MKATRPVLLFYCQHSVGMGHLKRAFNLAAALSDDFHVVFLNGGRFPQGLQAPESIELIDLPPLGMNADNLLYSQDERYDVDEARRRRRSEIIEAVRRFRPEVVMIELFPFGRKKFAGEILALLREARSQPRAPLVLCSLRDIMVNARRDQLRHDNRARWLTDRYFDAVLVHADPKLAKLEDSFNPGRPLRTPVHYTGYVLPPARKQRESAEPRDILVSAGGGLVGGVLFRSALEAQQRLWNTLGLTMTVVAGPFLPAAEWQFLSKLACRCEGLTLLRSVPDLNALYACHRVSVSQAGYNTVMDILRAGIPALVVPFAQGQEDEQNRRAEKLEKLGLLRLMPEEQLDGRRLAREIVELLAFRPDAAGIDLSGTVTTVATVRNLYEQGGQRPQNMSIPPSEATHV